MGRKRGHLVKRRVSKSMSLFDSIEFSSVLTSRIEFEEQEVTYAC
jgi:hypothetical protein